MIVPAIVSSFVSVIWPNRRRARRSAPWVVDRRKMGAALHVTFRRAARQWRQVPRPKETEMVHTVITRDGLERLTDELEQLRTDGRQQIAERLRAAVSTNANVVESAEYHEVRDDQATLERRIAVLEERIALAQLADPDGTNGLVDVGERVGVRDVESGRRVQYQLVGALEADVSQGRVSVLSPVGRALVGRRRGDVAVVEAPQGEVRLKILSIVTP
jgi:transcription elongation factor GreA